MSAPPPKKKRRIYTEEALQKALTEIRVNKRPVTTVCKELGVPKTTVLDRISGRTSDDIKKPGPDPVIGKEGEAKVVQWLLSIAKCGFPVKKQELLDVIQKIVKDEGIKNNFKDDRPGDRWFKHFLNRNKEVSMKSAEGINKARAQITEESIRLWFKELQTFLNNIGQGDILENPERIFNGDESGFALCPKTGKVLGPRGYKSLCEIKHGNEKENVTVLLTFNANGEMCPPCVVFPYIRPPKAVVNSMPDDWCLGKSETGWMRGDVFFEYVTNEFNNWLTEHNITKPVLLLVDGHKSHMSLMLSAMCEELGIILYALPPNTTHILQPADVSVFAPVKSYWKATVRNFLSQPENINATVTKTNFCKLLSGTLKHQSMPENIRAGFRRCGLYPFNPDSPDYTKCVRNTLERAQSQKSCTDITYADIATAKRVFKKIKPTLKKKNINVKVIMKEINNLKKTIPAEKDAEISIDTESGGNESSLTQTTFVDSNISNKTITGLTEPIECEMNATAELSISSLNAGLQNEAQQRTIDHEDSGPSLVIETVSALIHCSPNKTRKSVLMPNTNVTKTGIAPCTNNLDEILTYSNSSLNISAANKEESLPQLSLPVFDSGEPISSLHLSQSLLDVGSFVSLDDVVLLPYPDILSSTPVTVPETLTSNTPDPPLHPLGTIASSQSTPTETLTRDPDCSMNYRTPDPPMRSLVTIALSGVTTTPVAEAKTLTSNSISYCVSDPSTNRPATFDSSRLISTQVTATETLTSNCSSNPLMHNQVTIASSRATPTTVYLNATPFIGPSEVCSDAFKHHLMLPEVQLDIRNNTKKKPRTPAAISSSAWRQYYEEKEKLINEKKELTTKRKLERIKKQQEKEQLNKNTQKKAHPKRKRQPAKKGHKKSSVANKENVYDNEIKCAECESVLISDTEDDNEKNVGCDECIRWFHLKCTPLAGLEYSEVKDQDFKCVFCL